MQTVYFIVDESGAKGFSTNLEAELGEFGILAGYFVREQLLDRVRGELEAIRDEIAEDHEGKAHVVALSPGQQRAARRKVFDYLLDRDMYCCYEAMYVQGLHAATARTNAIPRPDIPRPPNVHYSDPRPEDPRLISELFYSLFGKALAYAIDNFGREVTLKVIVDNTDDGVMDEYRKGAQRLLDVFKPKIVTRTGFDKAEKKKLVHAAEMRTTVSRPEVELFFSKAKFDISTEDSGLTFAADILVGSVRHHLMKKVKAAGPSSLNSRDAISGHALEHQMYGASSLPSEQSLLDTMYRHPQRPLD